MARRTSEQINHYAKVLHYNCGVMDITAASRPVFRESGWEEKKQGAEAPALPDLEAPEEEITEEEAARRADASRQRSMRRAKAQLRRLALANDFDFFVTLTLDPARVDRYDMAAIVKKLNRWADNHVRRDGLKYILVPERHQDGAIHFHGFFNASKMPLVDSGTIDMDGFDKPRRPRSRKQREEWLRAGGRIVYNLPDWDLGFTTAIRVYGKYPAAVAYVCKYIGKQGQKPAGRWYYSGGKLAAPAASYAEIGPEDLAEMYPGKAFTFDAGGRQFCIVNGVKDPNFVPVEEIGL